MRGRTNQRAQRLRRNFILKIKEQEDPLRAFIKEINVNVVTTEQRQQLIGPVS